MPDHPNVWTDGSLGLDRVTGISASGAGFFAHSPEDCWNGSRWCHVDRVHLEGQVHSCRGFCSVPGPLQSVQRAEMWGVILALLSSSAVHLGVDNLGVVSHVKGHADEGMVHDGWVREVDDAADEAADFDRRRVGNAVIDARRNKSGVCGRWYPVVLNLHRFFIANSRAVVNHDGREGTAPDPLVWVCRCPVPRGVGWFIAVRDRAFFLGHLVLGILSGLRCLLLLSVLKTLLIGLTLLVFWLNGLPFLELCIGLLGVRNLVLVVFQYVELLVLYELWAGERLTLEKAHPRYLRTGRPISVSAVPFGPGIDIWRSCRFIGAMMRSLCSFAWWGLVGLCPALLVLIIAGFVILGGKSVVMDLLLGLVKVLLSFS